MKRIIKAINEGLDKSLIQFGGEIDFNKSTKIDMSSQDRIIANALVDKCKETGSMPTEYYEQIVEHAYYQVNDVQELCKLINMTIIAAGWDADLNWIDVSLITDMQFLFYKRTRFNCDISKWDTSNVTNMNSMFCGCESFNQPIGEWDVHNVTNMDSMFSECSEFNQDISDWDVRKVKNTYMMFANAKKFNKSIENWKLESLEYSTYMFYGCRDENIPRWYKSF